MDISIYHLLKIALLAIIQGAAELLPVSSSAHVIVAEKIMDFDPKSPEMTLLLVMLHTGTMFAVLVYFQRAWRTNYFQSGKALWPFAGRVASATVCTGVLGLGLIWMIERIVLHQEVEVLFGNLGLISGALAAVGLLIIYAGIRSAKVEAARTLGLKEACWIGVVQAFCIPFRGFSRSGATISAGLLLGAARQRVEEFSFALAVILTPPAVWREVKRLLAASVADKASLGALFLPSLLGMVFSFAAGLAALRWLSRWLENGRWPWFGFYCLLASAVVLALHRRGY